MKPSKRWAVIMLKFKRIYILNPMQYINNFKQKKKDKASIDITSSNFIF